MSSEQVTETRELVDFDQLVLNAHGEMTIVQGDHNSIVIEADQKVVDKLKTEVVNNALHISLVGSWFTRVKTAVKAGLTSHKIKYTVNLKHLSRLEVSDAAKVLATNLQVDSLAMLVDGAGYVRIQWLQGKSLTVDLPGASNVEISGQLDRQTVTLGGLGRYEAPRLKSANASVEMKGAGKAVVAATEELNVVIRGLGKVSYHGEPRVNKDISGLGKVENLGPIVG